MITIGSNINFKGYKNIIVENANTSIDRNFTYLAAQLTDENTPHLQKWLELQNEMGVKHPSDIIMTLYCKSPAYNTSENQYMFLGAKSMYMGDELRIINNSKEEKLAVKAYTLLASITKQISCGSFFNQDKDYVNVIRNVFRTLTTLSEEKTAASVVTNSVYNTNFQETAAKLNKIIAKTMEKYFK